MKKILLALFACVAMLGFNSCSESVESQIFDLTYDVSAVEQGEIMIYQQTYQQIFAAEIAKVAKPATETGYTYMINSSEKNAKATVENAFNKAIAEVEKLYVAGSLKGLKVIVNYSNASNQKAVAWLTYTFK